MTEAKDTMTNDYGARQMWKVVIKAPIETVWSTIVRTDVVQPFLFGGICDTEDGLKPGKPFRMVSKNRQVAIVYGEVLEFTPPTRFSHTISFTSVEGEKPGRTTYELREVPGGTELTLISDAIPGTKTGKMVGSGPFMVENLKRQIETGKPAFSGAMVMAMAPLVSLFSPKISRIENWPLTCREA